MPKFSKKAMQARLEAAGYWHEFLRGRERWRLFFKGEGFSPQEAAKKAWLKAYDEVLGNHSRDPEADALLPDPSELEAPPNDERGESKPQTVKRRPRSAGAPDLQRLAQAAWDKDASFTDIRKWVFKHMSIPWDQIDAEGVPHPGAPSYLEWARSEPDAFFKSLTRDAGVADQAEVLAGEGDALDRLCEDLLRFRKESRS